MAASTCSCVGLQSSGSRVPLIFFAGVAGCAACGAISFNFLSFFTFLSFLYVAGCWLSAGALLAVSWLFAGDSFWYSDHLTIDIIENFAIDLMVIMFRLFITSRAARTLFSLTPISDENLILPNTNWPAERLTICRPTTQSEALCWALSIR